MIAKSSEKNKKVRSANVVSCWTSWGWLIRFERGEPEAAMTMRCRRYPGIARDRRGAGLCIAMPEHCGAGARMIE